MDRFPINIKTAPDPTEIIWENLDISTNEAWFRRLLVLFFVLCLLAVGGVIIYLVRIYRSTIANTDDCDDSNDKNANELEGEHEINCFCSRKTISIIMENQEFRDI